MNFAMKAVVMLAVLALVSAEEKTAEEQTLVAVADQDAAASHYYGAWRGYGHGWGYGHGHYNPYGYNVGHPGWSYRHRRSADDSADLSTDASHYGRYGGLYGSHYGGRGYGYGHGYFNPTGYYSAHSGSQYRHRRSADESADLTTDASHYGRYGGLYGGHYGGYYGNHRGGYYGGHRGYGYGGYSHYY